VSLRSLQGDAELLGMLREMAGNVPAGGDERSALRQALRSVLREIIEDPARAVTIAQANMAGIDAVGGRIANVLRAVFIETAGDLAPHLPAPPRGFDYRQHTGADAARFELGRLYREFEWYDMVILPIEHGTDTAETRRVDIVRISPLDGDNLIAETIGNTGRKKLAGTALWAFGAFLARFWRANDMLWGRLDAAEIIVRNVLKNRGLDDGALGTLIDEVQREILITWLTPDTRLEIYNLLRSAFEQSPQGVCTAESVRAVLSSLDGLDGRLTKVLTFCLDDEELLNYFKTGYQVNRQLDPAETLPLAGRAARITGKILDDLASKTGLAKQGALLARLTAGFWAVVEISVPQSMARAEARHLGALGYLIAAILIVVGFVTSGAVFHAGLLIFGVVLALHAITAALYGVMRRERGSLRALLIVLVLFILALAAWGAYDLFGRIEKWGPGKAAATANP
jgi:hypothetical protein